VEPRRDAEQAAQQQREKAAEQARVAATEAKAQAERAAAAQRHKETQRKAEEARKAEQARKAEEARLAREQEAEQKAQAAREAKQRAQREAQLQRELALEEEGEAFARSGVVDEYRALLVQTIERNWIKPPSARPGLECTLYVTQATGGTVLDVKLGACNGDQAVRESVTNAVYRSTPLPAPRDPRAFQRQLVIVFKPTE
jgi:colicin import membrane protein